MRDFDDPKMAGVGQRHPLRPAGRARRVEEHCDLARRRPDRFEVSRVAQRVETVRATVAEGDDRKVGGHTRRPLRIGEDELYVGVAQNVFDRLVGEFVVDRHRYQTGPHRTEIGRQKLHPVGRQDRDPLAAFQSARHEAACHRARRPIQVAMGEFPGAFRAAQIDQGGRIRIFVPVQQVAQIVKRAHLLLVLVRRSFLGQAPNPSSTPVRPRSPV